VELKLYHPFTHFEVLVEFVEDQTHAVHQAIHIRGLAFRVSGAAVGGQSELEGLKVCHPLECEIVWLHIGLIEDQDERQLRFVQDTMRS
jgi:hypothetical protein